LNPGPCIFYALFQPTELSSRGYNINVLVSLNKHNIVGSSKKDFIIQRHLWFLRYFEEDGFFDIV